jgi:hypothetical protein
MIANLCNSRKPGGVERIETAMEKNESDEYSNGLIIRR